MLCPLKQALPGPFQRPFLSGSAWRPHSRRALVASGLPFTLCPRGRRMNPLPPLLETYEQARLLFEAKG